VTTPIATTNNPVPVIMEPFTVHTGLLYINEADGPTTDLLCSKNSIPRVSIINPIMIDALLPSFASFIYQDLVLVELYFNDFYHDAEKSCCH
jgi:hypothetical protein